MSLLPRHLCLGKKSEVILMLASPTSCQRVPTQRQTFQLSSLKKTLTHGFKFHQKLYLDYLIQQSRDLCCTVDLDFFARTNSQHKFRASPQKKSCPLGIHGLLGTQDPM